MADSTGFNRDTAAQQRADIAERLAAARALIESDLPFDAIEELLETTIDDVVERLTILSIDERDMAAADWEADEAMHSHRLGGWCYVCDQQTVARIEEQRRNEAGE